jgi:hypothetical protein
LYLALFAALLLNACAAPRIDALSEPTATASAEPSTTTIPAQQPAPTATLPQAAQSPNQGAHEMALVGNLKLETNKAKAFGDITSYGQLAIIGSSGWGCANSVSIIDIANPAAPTLLAQSPPLPNLSMEDVEAIRIGDRDVLAIGLQGCGVNRRRSPGGLDLIDITDPRNPVRLSTFALRPVEDDANGHGVHGVHELDVTQTADGRALALLAVPDLEVATAGEDGRGGVGDLLILDISDPTAPRQIAEWGAREEPALGPALMDTLFQGTNTAVFLHSVRASADGTRAYLSYWDASVMILDISDPASPRYLGRTTYGADEEGNAHSVASSDEGHLLVQADEDFESKNPMITSNTFSGERPVVAHFTSMERPEGAVVYAGRACPAGTVSGQPEEDPLAAEIVGVIALLDPGGCRPDEKVARAQMAGASAVLLYGGETVREAGPILEGRPLRLPDGASMAQRIPVLIISHATAQELIGAEGPVRIATSVGFDGWGGLRLFDLSDPARPVQISAFRTAGADDEGLLQTSSSWRSAHNPELRDTVLFVSWFAEGVRAVDIADPRAPREIGFWAGAGVPPDAPPVDIWGIALHGDLILASDRNFGLYILRLGQDGMGK